MNVTFFDFGNVLASFDTMRSCEGLSAYSPRSAQEIYDTIFASGLEEHHYNRGEYTDEEWYATCTRLLELRDCPYERFADIWGDIFTRNDDIENVLAAIRPDIQKYILSNTNGLHWQWAAKHISLLDAYFPREQRILSYEAGSRKPERDIYEQALARAGVSAESAAFIDDKSENRDVFEEMGGHSIGYNMHTDNIADLERELARLGCLV